jgi:hypothetical protein
MTGTEAGTLLVAYLEIHNNQISEPDFTQVVTIAKTADRRASTSRTLVADEAAKDESAQSLQQRTTSQADNWPISCRLRIESTNGHAKTR